MNNNALLQGIKSIIDNNLCTGCGACAGAVGSTGVRMVSAKGGVQPEILDGAELPSTIWEACPGKGIDYPRLYYATYGQLPDDWRLGVVKRIWTGHASDPQIRRAGASGGVMTAVLIHLLESGRIDAAVLVKQGINSPEEASWIIARSREEIIGCSQSVYVPTAVLDSLAYLKTGERYAMTCLPEQSAALRVMQQQGDSRAKLIKFVLGPYTGTALDGRAIRALLRSNGVKDDDAIESLEWRAGEWPGYLQICTKKGRIIRSKKIYYNFLIPFYITQASLQSMDFANEFADLSVGDAWSPRFEGKGQGFSVVLARNMLMTAIVDEMVALEHLTLTETEPLEAAAMHGHMIDFKKRGGYLRNCWRNFTGKIATDCGLKPVPLGASRVVVELVIICVFMVCRTPLARSVMERMPERFLGPFFNWLRLAWKSLSKPTKRKGLRDLQMVAYEPKWRRYFDT